MGDNLLSGLGSLGLGNLEDLDVFEKEEEKEEKTGAGTIVAKEEDLLFDKSFQCPICDRAIKAKMVRTGKAHPLSSDVDLRPRFEGIDALKYDVVVCNACGYAALSKNFGYLAPTQKKAIKENIGRNYVPKVVDSNQKIYTYEDALERHKLALANTIVKRGKASEKANVCLKTAWIVRGMSEEFAQNEPNNQTKKEEYEKTELQFLATAFDGFVKARESEQFPIAGMDQHTLDYLLSALAIRLEKFDIALKLLGGILVAKDTNRRIKDKALDLKGVLQEKVSEKKRKEAQ